MDIGSSNDEFYEGFEDLKLDRMDNQQSEEMKEQQAFNNLIC